MIVEFDSDKYIEVLRKRIRNIEDSKDLSQYNKDWLISAFKEVISDMTFKCGDFWKVS